jgi:hypothetical protein
MIDNPMVLQPTEDPPTGDGWLPVSSDAAWFWDGVTWRRSPLDPRALPRPGSSLPWRVLRPHGLGSLLLLLLAAPLLVAVLAAIQIAGRVLAAATRVVVGVFAVGAAVALLVFLTSALMHS